MVVVLCRYLLRERMAAPQAAKSGSSLGPGPEVALHTKISATTAAWKTQKACSEAKLAGPAWQSLGPCDKHYPHKPTSPHLTWRYGVHRPTAVKSSKDHHHLTTTSRVTNTVVIRVSSTRCSTEKGQRSQSFLLSSSCGEPAILCRSQLKMSSSTTTTVVQTTFNSPSRP